MSEERTVYRLVEGKRSSELAFKEGERNGEGKKGGKRGRERAMKRTRQCEQLQTCSRRPSALPGGRDPVCVKVLMCEDDEM